MEHEDSNDDDEDGNDNHDNVDNDIDRALHTTNEHMNARNDENR